MRHYRIRGIIDIKKANIDILAILGNKKAHILI